MKILKIFSILLSYPSEELQQAIPEIRELVKQNTLLPDCAQRLEPLLNALEQDDLYEWQERYVLLFDRSRSLSLNLFEHVHGESRDRGGAMVDLLDMYRAAGFDLNAIELPDHLPVLLEFLSTQSPQVARDVLHDAGHILIALAERLQRRESKYAAVLQALVRFAHVSSNTEEAQRLLQEEMDDPENLTALDEVWEEAQVTFGLETNPAAGCTTTANRSKQDVSEQPIRIHRSAATAAPSLRGDHA